MLGSRQKYSRNFHSSSRNEPRRILLQKEYFLAHWRPALCPRPSRARKSEQNKKSPTTLILTNLQQHQEKTGERRSQDSMDQTLLRF
uniref:Uncharacterized protein n=1 Tax=uncultured marine virus TaxID=186617 RepID=A0A0F7L2R1_9VIRU|nr:hypothetical protein [uncultured marine virus]